MCNIFYHIHVDAYAESSIAVCSAYEHSPEVLWPPEQDDRQWTRDYVQVHQDDFCVLPQDGIHRTHLNKPWGKSFIRHQSGQKGKKGGTFLFSGCVMKLLCDLYVKQILCNVHAICIASEVLIFIFILFKTLQPGMEIQDFPEIGEWNLKNFNEFLMRYTCRSYHS